MKSNNCGLEPLLQVEELGVKFGQRNIITGVTFSLDPKRIVTLIGPNGAGKSTLLKAILGLVKLTTGKIKLQAGIKIGYMPQSLTVESLMPLSVKRFLLLANANISKQNLTKIMEEVGVTHLSLNAIQDISGGELQRVLLARALLNNPNLLVLDEPSQGVDVTGQNELYQLIMNIRDTRGTAILMVSHDLHIVMAGTDTVICLNHHVCCSGHPDTVSRDPEFIKLFGEQAPNFAVYTHHHNHQHDLKGRIVDDN